MLFGVLCTVCFRASGAIDVGDRLCGRAGGGEGERLVGGEGRGAGIEHGKRFLSLDMFWFLLCFLCFLFLVFCFCFCLFISSFLNDLPCVSPSASVSLANGCSFVRDRGFPNRSTSHFYRGGWFLVRVGGSGPGSPDRGSGRSLGSDRYISEKKHKCLFT